MTWTLRQQVVPTGMEASAETRICPDQPAGAGLGAGVRSSFTSVAVMPVRSPVMFQVAGTAGPGEPPDSIRPSGIPGHTAGQLVLDRDHGRHDACRRDEVMPSVRELKAAILNLNVPEPK